MTTEHKYAQVLRWIADGKTVQIRVTAKESEWRPMFLNWHDSSYRHLIQGDLLLDYEFRIKPHTVKIGSREVEAPVLEPEEGQTVYWTAASGTINEAEFDPERTLHANRAAAGSLFASAEAAEAFHKARVAYVLEQLA